METIREILQASQKDNKGVVVYFEGHTIGLVVTAISLDTVEGKNREYGRIAILLEKIQAVAKA